MGNLYGPHITELLSPHRRHSEANCSSKKYEKLSKDKVDKLLTRVLCPEPTSGDLGRFDVKLPKSEAHRCLKIERSPICPPALQRVFPFQIFSLYSLIRLTLLTALH